ncbi:helix-turn-helix domain-containing protein [Carnobacterium mobile]|uniref:helix-turn-helix domain-containing protein n=1 Tax=Carnobacterium mobile TaxID=2750 RepID=UPI00055892F7|nr:helix-turn-helix domain-containing protein [Carnobacterium mobile]
MRLIATRIYLNKKQTCDFLGIDNNTLDKWIKQYHFPMIKIDGVIRFEVEDIKEFMDTFKIL